MKQTNTPPISDEQLVDYLLKVLSDSEQQRLQHRINADGKLQQRLNTWQNALFTFHAETEEKTPPKRVWQGIKQQLFADAPVAPKRRFWRLGNVIPATALAFCLLFGMMFWLQNWSYRPDAQSQFHASVNASHFPITLWEIEGKQDSIAITSIRNVSESGRDCIAWLQQGDNAPIRLGIVPDTGDKTTRRIALPENLSANVGDRIIIAMVDHGDTRLPDVSKQHIVQLTAI